jgi:hypothetical protein
MLKPIKFGLKNSHLKKRNSIFCKKLKETQITHSVNPPSANSITQNTMYPITKKHLIKSFKSVLYPFFSNPK